MDTLFRESGIPTSGQVKITDFVQSVMTPSPDYWRKHRDCNFHDDLFRKVKYSASVKKHSITLSWTWWCHQMDKRASSFLGNTLYAMHLYIPYFVLLTSVNNIGEKIICNNFPWKSLHLFNCSWGFLEWHFSGDCFSPWYILVFMWSFFI